AVGRPPGGAVRPAGAQVLRVRPGVLAAGFPVPGGAADHRRVCPVLLHRPGRPRVVRLGLPADGGDGSGRVGGRWAEGDRGKRMKLDAGPWNREKILRKGAKHFLWLAFALWTGFTFVGFFTPIKDLGSRLVPFELGGWEAFWVFFYALATWGNAGFLREQVCKYMCPYARFQSAMFDRNTLLIAYDPMRGEPRGPRKRGLGSVLERARGLLDPRTAYDYVFRASAHPTAADNRAQARGTITLAGAGEKPAPLPKFAPEELGDCIDCTICVQVCPTGIDIRNGLQYECIACGACIDACDEVMGKMGYPRGL